MTDYQSAITHCDNCGCDWLDNGLNPIGCPYCKLTAQSAEIDALREEVELWRHKDAIHKCRRERLAEALREAYGKVREYERLRKAREMGRRPSPLPLEPSAPSPATNRPGAARRTVM